MELLFQEYELLYQQQLCAQSSMGEQTGDVIVPDSYGDIERIVDAFGTLTVQEARILPEGVSVSGTVLGGVIYVGEDGQTYSLPIKLPFSAKKELPSDTGEGHLRYRCDLQSVDARTVNSRKLLIRIGYQWGYEIYGPCTGKISYLQEPSETLQLQQKEYPLRLPTATGEKRFTVNEELELPAGAPAVSEILKWNCCLRLLEQKAVGGKGVFKTEVFLHLLYEDPQGKLCTNDWRIPISQYSDLSADTREGDLHTLLHMTELDLEPDSQIESRRLFLRIGVHALCMAYEVRSVTLIEDAYCTDALLEPQWQQWQCRPLLDSQTLGGTARWTGEEAIGVPLDLWARPEEGRKERQGDTLLLKIPVQCSLIYYDGEGKLRGKQIRPCMELELPLNREAECSLRDLQCTEGYCNPSSGTTEIRIPLQLTADSYGSQSLRSLKGGELLPLPEEKEPKPSVILRRTEEEEDLWALAKSYRTSVGAIRRANDLQEGPVPRDTMLLIPLQ